MGYRPCTRSTVSLTCSDAISRIATWMQRITNTPSSVSTSPVTSAVSRPSLASIFMWFFAANGVVYVSVEFREIVRGPDAHRSAGKKPLSGSSQRDIVAEPRVPSSMTGRGPPAFDIV